MSPFKASDLRALQVTGPDAVEFANAQVSADLPALGRDRWHPAAWCDPRGRALALMLVCTGDDGVDLVVPAEQAETVGRRLGLYTIGRSVEISQPRGVIAAWSEDRAPADPGLRQLAADPRRWLGANLKSPAPPAPELDARWRRADLRLGMPWLSAATAGEFLPQMLGLERLGGLSYRKGCYPGQEVIARVHYRGRVTRKPAGFRSETATPPAPGQTGRIEGGPGMITVLYALPDNGACAGLGIVPAQTPAGARFAINGAPGTVCDIDELC